MQVTIPHRNQAKLPDRKTYGKQYEQKQKPKRVEKDESTLKREIAEAYVQIVQQKNMFPTRNDLALVGITRDKIRHHFVNITGLRNAAKMMFPEAFHGIIEENDFTSQKAKANYQKKLRNIRHLSSLRQ